MGVNSLTTYAMICLNCGLVFEHINERTVEMKKRLHSKVCKNDGKPQYAKEYFKEKLNETSSSCKYTQRKVLARSMIDQNGLIKQL